LLAKITHRKREIYLVIVVLSLLIIGLILILIVGTSSQAKIKSTQVVVTAKDTPPSTAKVDSSVSMLKPRFDGETLKSYYIPNFYNKKSWDAMDKYTLNGYDIKGIVPSQDGFVVLLEKVSNP
jgi:hypothetical protein